MQRYFVQPNQFKQTNVIITGDDVHHIAKVMRFQPGDKVICSNGLDKDAIVEIQSIDSKEVIGKIDTFIEQTGETKTRVVLVQGLPKADKMELIIQKGTEVGVTEFIPFTSQRTVVKLDEKKEQKKIERWGKIAKEAAEQSHRSVIPQIKPLLSWKEVMEFIKDKTVFIAYEKENTMKLSQALNQLSAPEEIILIIGPEGGFSEEEVLLAEQQGAISISLGKRILRTETAGLVGIANIIYHLEELEE